MKLLIAIIDSRDIRSLRNSFVESGVRFTEVGSTGGFLRRGNVTLLLGVEDDQVDAVLDIIKLHCHTREEVMSVVLPDTRMYAQPIAMPMTVLAGGAQVFVLNVESTLHV